MINQVETEIKGVNYKFMPLTATPARALLDKLINRLGDSISLFIKGLNQIGDIVDFSLDKTTEMDLLQAFATPVGDSVGSFTSKVTPEFHKELIEAFIINNVSYQEESGEWIKMTRNVAENYFALQLGLETKLLLWTLKEQYADFFEPVRMAIASAGIHFATRAEQNSSSQKGATGLSGE